MKKYFLNRAAILAATAILACGLTACSDDDEGGSTPQGPTTTFNGKLLTSVGYYNYRYDSKGRCVEASFGNNGGISIDYEEGIMYWDDMEYKVTFNGAGYITSMSASISESYEGNSYNLSENNTFSYDGSGHLTGITGRYTESYNIDGEKYSLTDNHNTKIIWNNGLLVSYNSKDEENDDGDKSVEESTIKFTAGSTDNKYNQWTAAEEEGLMETEGLGHVGLFGKGSSKLIQSYIETYKENGREMTDTYNFTFTLNDDGTINSEKTGNYGTKYYSYNSFQADNDDGAKAPGIMTKTGKKKGGIKIFNLRTRLENLKTKVANNRK